MSKTSERTGVLIAIILEKIAHEYDIPVEELTDIAVEIMKKT